MSALSSESAIARVPKAKSNGRVIQSIQLPEGRIWLIPETGERFDSDGNWLPESEQPGRDASRRYRPFR